MEADENPNKKEHEMVMVCFSPPNLNGEETSPESGAAAGDVKAAGQDCDSSMYLPWSKKNESTNSNGAI